MKPIDVIKTGIDSDLTKYHSTTLCKIVGDKYIKNIRGVGLCALVYPFDRSGAAGDKNVVVNEKNMFPVFIVNRPQKWFEERISDKYFVLTLNPVQDRGSPAVGLLVSNSAFHDLSILMGEIKDKEGEPLESKTRELVTDDG